MVIGWKLLGTIGENDRPGRSGSRKSTRNVEERKSSYRHFLRVSNARDIIRMYTEG